MINIPQKTANPEKHRIITNSLLSSSSSVSSNPSAVVFIGAEIANVPLTLLIGRIRSSFCIPTTVITRGHSLYS